MIRVLLHLFRIVLYPILCFMNESTVEIVYNEHEDQAEFARYNRFSL